MLNLLEQTKEKDLQILSKRAISQSDPFFIQPIRDLVLLELNSGFWIAPYATGRYLGVLTNSLQETFDIDEHKVPLAFLKSFPSSSVDGVLYAPPRSFKALREYYSGLSLEDAPSLNNSYWGNEKKEIARILKLGGKVITCSGNSGGIGEKNGFEKRKVLLVSHGSWIDDTICVVEEKVREKTPTTKVSYEKLPIF